MKITQQTKKAIEDRMLPPWCSSIDMAKTLIKRFLQRDSFSFVDIEYLTEEEGQRVLAFLEKIFDRNIQQIAAKKVIEEEKEGTS